MPTLISSSKSLNGIYRAVIIETVSEKSAHVYIPALHREHMPFKLSSDGDIEGLLTQTTSQDNTSGTSNSSIPTNANNTTIKKTDFPIAQICSWSVCPKMNMGDQSWVMFENGDAEFPVIVGDLGAILPDISTVKFSGGNSLDSTQTDLNYTYTLVELGDGLYIKQNLTTVNSSSRNGNTIQYIVIHYTANNGDTAKANTDYFKSVDRQASAHYFVDENPDIWQCVTDDLKAWHCGGSLESSHHPYHKICTNENSIGIEICSRKNESGYYFMPQAVNNAASLTKALMSQYNISIDNVIRHYDVTGKICPEPFVRSESAWEEFKNSLR